MDYELKSEMRGSGYVKSMKDNRGRENCRTGEHSRKGVEAGQGCRSQSETLRHVKTTIRRNEVRGADRQRRTRPTAGS